MTPTPADAYLGILEKSRATQLALLACSAALRLDDEIAGAVINLVAESNGCTQDLLRQIKSLGCVWRQWDGTWYISEDVRRPLLDQLYREVPEETQAHLHELVAAHADQQAAGFGPDGQVTAYRARQSKLEAAYQRTCIPEQSEAGAVALAELWRSSPGSAATATAKCVDYLATEFHQRLKHVPSEVLFLQGMAARSRRDRQGQRKYFRMVWERGGRGYIVAVSAHLYGLLAGERRIAERAFRDSIEWYESGQHRAQVYHSLGNLLAKERRRWAEAEEAYRTSLRLALDAAGRAQVYHSLGNLLAKERQRWEEAEEAYTKSLQLDVEAFHRAQVYHSLGNLLAKERQRWEEAQEAYAKSLELDRRTVHRAQVLASRINLLSKFRTPEKDAEAEVLALEALELDPSNPWTAGVCHRVLADIHERRGDSEKAIADLEALLETNRRLGNHQFDGQINERIAALRMRSRTGFSPA